jgi:hypothetical protein
MIGRRKANVTAALCALFCLAFLALVSSLLIRGKALTTGFYIGALDETHAFNRVYHDLLADPEFADAIDPFFGELGVQRSFAVSTLRLIAPPDRLRDWTELALDRPVEYLRGDVDYYSGDIALPELIDSQRSALAAYVRQALIASPSRPSGSMEEFERELDAFSQELANGRIPSAIPDAELSPEATERITDIILRPLNPQTAEALRPQVVTYISLNDILGALSVVAPAALDEQITEANSETLDLLGGDTTVDPADTFAEALTKNGAVVGDRLHEMRSTVDTYSPKWLAWVSITVMVLVLAALLWLYRDGRRMLLAPGFLLIAAGLATWAVSVTFGPWLLEAIAGRPLAVAQMDAPEGWGMPQSARVLVGDINRTMFEDLASFSGWAGLFLALPGAISILGYWAIGALPHAWRGKYDWVVSRDALPVLSIIILAGALAPLIILLPPFRSDPVACNGHPELCDRRYDEVAYPATHNSMANSTEGWLLPSEDVPIRQQLEDGVRALLIDTHYWDTSTQSIERLSAAGSFPPAVLDLMANLLVDSGDPPSGVYLCHVSCWLGAISLYDALSDIKEFMDEHPNEVVTLMIEDGVSADDTAAVFAEAGLLPYLFTPEEGRPWPTLGEMIESGNRLVVMAERQGGSPDWHAKAWDLTQDTAFDVSSPGEFDCALNRGAADNELFLVNHWINAAAPDRVDSNMVNTAAVITARARRCEAERGQMPNFIAVNFHRIGGLFDAIDAINGVD